MADELYSEDDLIPLSALQHFAFCERQCALIHIEQQWAENRLTAEGRVMHERVHEAGSETRPTVRTARGLRFRSLRLGLTGVADVVELRPDPAGVAVPGLRGAWQLVPVEYKRGRPKPDRCDEVQLCAQALCLEEMLGARITSGAIFYGQPRRRLEVALDPALREETLEAVNKVRQLIVSGLTPPAYFAPKCKACSLFDLCQPATAGSGKSARRYLGQMLTP